MRMYSKTSERDIPINDESIYEEINKLMDNKESWLVISKSDEEFIQCYCEDECGGLGLFCIERRKEENGFLEETPSSKLSTQRFFKKYSRGEEYKTIKCWNKK